MVRIALILVVAAYGFRSICAVDASDNYNGPVHPNVITDINMLKTQIQHLNTALAVFPLTAGDSIAALSIQTQVRNVASTSRIAAKNMRVAASAKPLDDAHSALWLSFHNTFTTDYLHAMEQFSSKKDAIAQVGGTNLYSSISQDLTTLQTSMALFSGVIETGTSGSTTKFPKLAMMKDEAKKLFSRAAAVSALDAAA